MKLSQKTITRSFCLGLCCLYFFNNIAFAHKPEANFWSERRKAVSRHSEERSDEESNALRLASLPAGFQLPSPTLLPHPQPFSLKGEGGPLPLPLGRGTQGEGEIASIIQSLPALYGGVRNVSQPSPSPLPISGEGARRAGEGKELRLVIHIQDVHRNPEAQANISKTIQELINQHKVDLVALEGAFQPIDFSSVRRFPYPESTKAVADYLLKENKITGSIYTALTSGTDIPPFVGVDQREHYFANVDAYKKSAPHIKEYKNRLSALENDLSQKKAQTLNPELLAFDKKVQSYRQGALKVGEYVKFLSRHPERSEGSRRAGEQRDSSVANTDGRPQNDGPASIKTFLQALDMEEHLNFSQVEQERSQLLSQLVKKLKKDQLSGLLTHSVAYRLGSLRHTDFYQYLKDLCRECHVDLSLYPVMNSYVQYVLLSDNLNPEKLIADMKTLEDQGYASLAKTAQEKNLISESKQLYLVGKLLDFSLTAEEWREYVQLSRHPTNGLWWGHSEAEPKNFVVREGMRGKGELGYLSNGRVSSLSHVGDRYTLGFPPQQGRSTARQSLSRFFTSFIFRLDKNTTDQGEQASAAQAHPQHPPKFFEEVTRQPHSKDGLAQIGHNLGGKLSPGFAENPRVFITGHTPPSLSFTNIRQHSKGSDDSLPQIQVSSQPFDLSSFESFYQEAHQRDQAITSNLLKAMDEHKASVAVLVTGGFHSTGIDQRLKEAGISTVSFTPKVTKVDSESGSAYLSVFTQEKTPLDRLFQGEKLFVSELLPVNTIPIVHYDAAYMAAGGVVPVVVELAGDAIKGDKARGEGRDITPQGVEYLVKRNGREVNYLQVSGASLNKPRSLLSRLLGSERTRLPMMLIGIAIAGVGYKLIGISRSEAGFNAASPLAESSNSLLLAQNPAQFLMPTWLWISLIGVVLVILFRKQIASFIWNTYVSFFRENIIRGGHTFFDDIMMLFNPHLELGISRALRETLHRGESPRDLLLQLGGQEGEMKKLFLIGADQLGKTLSQIVGSKVVVYLLPNPAEPLRLISDLDQQGKRTLAEVRLDEEQTLGYLIQALKEEGVLGSSSEDRPPSAPGASPEDPTSPGNGNRPAIGRISILVALAVLAVVAALFFPNLQSWLHSSTVEGSGAKPAVDAAKVVGIAMGLMFSASLGMLGGGVWGFLWKSINRRNTPFLNLPVAPATPTEDPSAQSPTPEVNQEDVAPQPPAPDAQDKSLWNALGMSLGTGTIGALAGAVIAAGVLLNSNLSWNWIPVIIASTAVAVVAAIPFFIQSSFILPAVLLARLNQWQPGLSAWKPGLIPELADFKRTTGFGRVLRFRRGKIRVNKAIMEWLPQWVQRWFAWHEFEHWRHPGWPEWRVGLTDYLSLWRGAPSELAVLMFALKIVRLTSTDGHNLDIDTEVVLKKIRNMALDIETAVRTDASPLQIIEKARAMVDRAQVLARLSRFGSSVATGVLIAQGEIERYAQKLTPRVRPSSSVLLATLFITAVAALLGVAAFRTVAQNPNHVAPALGPVFLVALAIIALFMVSGISYPDPKPAPSYSPDADKPYKSSTESTRYNPAPSYSPESDMPYKSSTPSKMYEPGPSYSPDADKPYKSSTESTMYDPAPSYPPAPERYRSSTPSRMYEPAPSYSPDADKPYKSSTESTMYDPAPSYEQMRESYWASHRPKSPAPKRPGSVDLGLVGVLAVAAVLIAGAFWAFSGEVSHIVMASTVIFGVPTLGGLRVLVHQIFNSGSLRSVFKKFFSSKLTVLFLSALLSVPIFGGLVHAGEIAADFREPVAAVDATRSFTAPIAPEAGAAGQKVELPQGDAEKAGRSFARLLYRIDSGRLREADRLEAERLLSNGSLPHEAPDLTASLERLNNLSPFVLAAARDNQAYTFEFQVGFHSELGILYKNRAPTLPELRELDFQFQVLAYSKPFVEAVKDADVELNRVTVARGQSSAVKDAHPRIILIDKDLLDAKRMTVPEFVKNALRESNPHNEQRVIAFKESQSGLKDLIETAVSEAMHEAQQKPGLFEAETPKAPTVQVIPDDVFEKQAQGPEIVHVSVLESVMPTVFKSATGVIIIGPLGFTLDTNGLTLGNAVELVLLQMVGSVPMATNLSNTEEQEMRNKKVIDVGA